VTVALAGGNEITRAKKSAGANSDSIENADMR